MAIKACSLYDVVTIVRLRKVTVKKTALCFSNTQYGFRCSRFDDLFEEEQPKADACTIVVVALREEATFPEVAGMILGVPSKTPESIFADLFKKSGCSPILTQIERTVRPVKSGKEFESFSFVENKNGGISIVSIFQNSEHSTLSARPREFSYGHPWRVGTYFLIRNLNPQRVVLQD